MVSNEFIARKNDEIRKSILVGVEPPTRVLYTAGVFNLPVNKIVKLLSLVRDFDDFNEDNDPYGEHDGAKVIMDGEEYLWKFDCVNRDDMETYKRDGVRILTIMRLSEY